VLKEIMKAKRKWGSVLFSVILLQAVRPASADARLLAFDDPTRVPDRFIVLLNDTVPWQHESRELPPNSGNAEANAAEAARQRAALVQHIAEELASTYHGTIGSVMHAAFGGFTILMSDEDARAMSKDPRIESITADHTIGNDRGAVQAVPQPPATCKEAIVSPVSGHAECVDPRGAPVDPPPQRPSAPSR
jgi:hypothetical protein